MSKLHFKYGAMNSGKTNMLIATAFNYSERNMPTVVIKPSIDTKGGQMLVTRSGSKRPVDILATPEINVRNAVRDFMKLQKIPKLFCILVDEAQLLTEAQVDQLLQIAKLDEISVIAYGLRTDFKTELFTGSKRLIALADNIEKIPTMCRCGSQAEFNCRKNNNQFIFQGPQVAIDGEGDITYESLCGACYITKQAMASIKTQHPKASKKRILKNVVKGE
jgi:thymidine kinase